MMIRGLGFALEADWAAEMAALNPALPLPTTKTSHSEGRDMLAVRFSLFGAIGHTALLSGFIL